MQAVETLTLILRSQPKSDKLTDRLGARGDTLVETPIVDGPGLGGRHHNRQANVLWLLIHTDAVCQSHNSHKFLDRAHP